MTVTFSLKHWCAREHLYISYVGQSIHPPKDFSIMVVNELLDSLDKLFDFGEIDGKTKKARMKGA